MLLNKRPGIMNSLSMKLFLAYGVLFAVGMVVVYCLTVVTLSKSLEKRMDSELVEEISEFEARYAQDGLEELKKEFVLEAESENEEEIFFQLISPEEELLATSDLSYWEGISTEVLAEDRPMIDQVRYSNLFDTQRNHNVRAAQKRVHGGYVIQIGRVSSADEALLAVYKHQFGIVVLIMFPLIGLVMWGVSKRSVRGITRVTEAANQVKQGDLQARAQISRDSNEIMILGQTFNAMSDKVESLIREIRDVTNNIAHDLRTPVTRIRGIAETTLRGTTDSEAYEDALGSIIEESDNLTGMINTLLEIAETDSGISKVEKKKADINTLTKEAYELFLPLAQTKKINLRTEFDAGPLYAACNLQQMQRVIANLLDNAIKYTEEGGSVNLMTHRKNGSVNVSVKDSGVGIPAESVEDIFKPFYRCDQSRSAAGNGLGLSFVRSVVASHAGSISVKSDLHEGSTFSISLPCAD